VGCARLLFIPLAIGLTVHGFHDLMAAVCGDFAVVRDHRLLAVAQGAGDFAKLQHAHEVRDDVHVAPVADLILNNPVALRRRGYVVRKMRWPDRHSGFDERLKERRAEGQNLCAVAACAFGEEEEKDTGANGLRHLLGRDGG